VKDGVSQGPYKLFVVLAREFVGRHTGNTVKLLERLGLDRTPAAVSLVNERYLRDAATSRRQDAVAEHLGPKLSMYCFFTTSAPIVAHAGADKLSLRHFFAQNGVTVPRRAI
jgi:hypothetical protein